MPNRRQTIIDRVAALLDDIVSGQTVTVESDEGVRTHTFETTFAGRVHELPTYPIEKAGLPAVAFGEMDATVEYPGKDWGYKVNRLRLWIRVHAQETENGATKTRTAMNDVIAAMASERRLSNRFGGSIQSIKLTSNRLEFDESGQWLGTGMLEYELMYQNSDDEL